MQYLATAPKEGILSPPQLPQIAMPGTRPSRNKRNHPGLRCPPKPSAPGFGDEAGRGVLCGQAANGQSGLWLVGPCPAFRWSALVRPLAGRPLSGLSLVSPCPAFRWSALVRPFAGQPLSGLSPVSPCPAFRRSALARPFAGQPCPAYAGRSDGQSAGRVRPVYFACLARRLRRFSATTCGSIGLRAIPLSMAAFATAAATAGPMFGSVAVGIT